MLRRDKEELGSIVANQSTKIAKLDGERMDYQKKIIEVGFIFFKSSSFAGHLKPFLLMCRFNMYVQPSEGFFKENRILKFKLDKCLK